MNAFSALNPVISLSGSQIGVHRAQCTGGYANKMLNFGSHLIIT